VGAGEPLFLLLGFSVITHNEVEQFPTLPKKFRLWHRFCRCRWFLKTHSL